MRRLTLALALASFSTLGCSLFTYGQSEDGALTGFGDRDACADARRGPDAGPPETRQLRRIADAVEALVEKTGGDCAPCPPPQTCPPTGTCPPCPECPPAPRCDSCCPPTTPQGPLSAADQAALVRLFRCERVALRREARGSQVLWSIDWRDSQNRGYHLNFEAGHTLYETIPETVERWFNYPKAQATRVGC